MRNLFLGLIVTLSILASDLVIAKPEGKTKTGRKPTQVEDLFEMALRTPHNCRVIIHYLFHSETEKIELLPFRVKNETECQQVAQQMKPVLDEAIKSKTVKAVWIGN